LLADVAATLVVFAASTVAGNASLYDPYWSVAPPVIVIAWGVRRTQRRRPADRRRRARRRVGGPAHRELGPVLARAAARDWRYVELRVQAPGGYRGGWSTSSASSSCRRWSCSSACCRLAGGGRRYAAAQRARRRRHGVTASAIAVEALADRQLHRFAADPAKPGARRRRRAVAVVAAPELRRRDRALVRAVALRAGVRAVMVVDRRRPIAMVALFVFVSVR